MAGDPVKLAELMRANGYSDEDIVSKLKEVRSAAPGYVKPPAFGKDEPTGGPLTVPSYSLESFLKHPQGQDWTNPMGDGNAQEVMNTITGQALGGVAGKAVGGLARSIPWVAKSVLGRIGAGAAEGAAFSGASGGDPITGAAFGGGAQTVGEALGAMGRGIQNSKGGQARALTEQHGGSVGPLTAQSGIPETEGMAPTRQNVGKISRVAAKNIREELAAQFEGKYGAPSRAARNAVETADTGGIPQEVTPEKTVVGPNKFAGQAGQDELLRRRAALANLRPAPPPLPDESQTQRIFVHQAMRPQSPLPRPEGMGFDETQPRVPIPSAVADRAQAYARGPTPVPPAPPRPAAPMAPADQLRDVTPLRGKVADLLYSDRTPTHIRPYLRAELDRLDEMRLPNGHVAMTERQLNDVRGRFQDMADYGIPGGPGQGSTRDRAFKDIAATAREMVNQGPYKEANSIYHQGMNELRTDRQLLGLKGEPGANVAAEDRAVALALRSAGNDSEAAGSRLAPGALDQFGARHPELSRQLAMPDLIRAKETLQFGLGGNGTENLIQATARAGHGATRHAIEIAAHNAQAAAGRLAYGPAGTIQGAPEHLAPFVNQLVAAAQQKRDADAQAIQTIFGKIKSPDMKSRNPPSEDQAPGP